MEQIRKPTDQEVIALAAAARVAIKTARRALVEGVDVIRGETTRERLRHAMDVVYGRKT